MLDQNHQFLLSSVINAFLEDQRVVNIKGVVKDQCDIKNQRRVGPQNILVKDSKCKTKLLHPQPHV